jgi:dipeptidase D
MNPEAMYRRRRMAAILPLLALPMTQCAPQEREAARGELSGEAVAVATHAVTTYSDSAAATLADLVAFRTVRVEGVENAENPEFRAMTDYLRTRAAEFGFDFADHGAVVVIGLGDAQDRLGLVTHGDVQPADHTKWAQDPFSLDTVSEPERLIGRGAEDDKGPIAVALYAMKSLIDHVVPLRRRVELIISYTEESDWEPFREFLAQWEAPRLNVALDSDYPVVIAEKGWNAIFIGIAPDEPVQKNAATGPIPEASRLISFHGGAFLSQIPADAQAVIADPTAEAGNALRNAAGQDTLVQFTFQEVSDSLIIDAHGRSAHSSTPWAGQNAITHLSALLGSQDWPATQASRMVRVVNDLVGTGDYAELFGDLAYANDFMGPLTLSLTTLGQDQGGMLVAGINARRPVGKNREQFEEDIRSAVDGWGARTGIDVELSTSVGDPHYIDDAPHVPVLLEVFRHFSGQEEAGPTSIGGGTHARLLPNGVNFGPAMPGEQYSGHSEHEFMSREALRLNLEMYAAMLVELAGGHDPRP